MEAYFTALFWLVFAHCVGDYPLQGDFLAGAKKNSLLMMFVHCFIWTGCIAAALTFLGIFAWWKIMLLFSTHLAIDDWKVRASAGLRGAWGKKRLTKLLYVDQFAHLAFLVISAAKFSDYEFFIVPIRSLHG